MASEVVSKVENSLTLGSTDFEVVIIGAGAAGLSAGLYLGRSRRNTLILDGGATRNAPADQAHNMFTRDGTPPSELVKIGKEQLQPYKSITLMQGIAKDVEKTADGDWLLTVACNDGSERRVTSKILLFTTGLRDILPDVPKFAAHWGKDIFQCPYCHGYEFADMKTIIACPPMPEFIGMYLMKVSSWTHPANLTMFTNGVVIPEQFLSMAKSMGVTVKEGVMVEILENDTDGSFAGVKLDTGEELRGCAMYYAPPREQSCPLLAKLGCAFEESGVQKGRIKADVGGATNVPNLYVAGDASAALMAEQVVTAAAGAATAAVMINVQLLKAGVSSPWRKTPSE